MRAVITGAKGQDGTLLTQLLQADGIEVLPINRESTASFGPVTLTDDRAMTALIRHFAPDQIYHLAACHHSSDEEDSPRLDREMVDTNFRAVEVLAAAVVRERPHCRILVAGSSQMYRPERGTRTFIDETTPTNPASFYGATKAWSRQLLEYYRAKRGVFATMAILFNHESPLRGSRFVTRKITQAAARASLGQDPALHLRDITSETDWSSASDIVAGLRLAMQATEPADYVLASGVAHRVEDVLKAAFEFVGLDWRAFTSFDDPPAEPRGVLIGNAARARVTLGWRPTADFKSMITEMVAMDVERLRASRRPN